MSGLTRFDPAAHRPNAHPPRVGIEAAELPGRTVSFPSALELSWSERSLAFRVAVLSFRSRNRTAYRARLAGLEDAWLPLRRVPELRYTNLPAGEFQVLVQGINESGLWGEVASLPIRVRPPFWMITSFRTAGILLLIALAASAHRWRTLGAALDMSHMRRQLAALHEKRTATLKDMHERGISTLQICSTCGRCFDHTAMACPEDGSRLETPRPLPFELLGRYRFERVLGQGGMATILSARDLRLERDVAIKLIRPEHFGDAEMKARFEREAQTVARISHPGVIGLFDSGELPDGTAYLVMEKLSGHDLSYFLAVHGPGTPRQVATLSRQASAALAAAHQAGVVHRDIKPANIFLVDDPGGFRVKVLDFGLAKSMAYEKGLTQSGMIVGTPEYMSPEQVRGWNVDKRTDVYSLGAVCYEALTGRRAIKGEDIGRIMVNVINTAPEPLSSVLSGAPKDAESALAAALEKEWLDRPSDIAAWGASLAEALEEMPGGPTRGWPFGS